MSARRFGISIWILAASIAITFLLAAHAGLRLNTSPSAPKGIWRASPIGANEYARPITPPSSPCVIATTCTPAPARLALRRF